MIRNLFKNRRDAGEKLAEKLKKYKGTDAIILAIPRGGVAVGASIAKKLELPLDLIIPRKLPIPDNPEMGFGAILGDGTVLLNDEVVEGYNISEEQIKKVSEKVLAEVKRREKKYRGKQGFPEIQDKTVIVVDDGLVTGFTVLAAIKAIKKYQPKKIIVAAPVSPESAVEKIKPKVDELICLYVQKGYSSFAVASFYEDFHDLSDEEVIEILREF